MQAVHEPTPPKKPAESAALTGHTAAAHAVPVAFFGSHRVFLGAPPTGTRPSTPVIKVCLQDQLYVAGVLPGMC